MAFVYAKNFLADHTPPETINSFTTNEAIADRFGQVYISTRENFATLRVISEAGAEVDARTFSELYNDFAFDVDDDGDAYKNIGAIHVSHSLIGDGRYLLASLVAVKGPFPDIFLTQYKRYFILYECRDGQFPRYIDACWSTGQETLIDCNAFICGAGTDNDPIGLLGLYRPFVGTPTDTRVYILPSINEFLTGNFSAWWQFTTGGPGTLNDIPRLEFQIDDKDGFNARAGFARTGNGIRTPQGLRGFKLDGETKFHWYISRSGLQNHLTGTGIKNEWIENVIAPVNTTALISLELGTVTPATVAPVGTATSRVLSATVADATSKISPALSDDGKKITDPLVDGDAFYYNPKILRIAGSQYVTFVMVSYDPTDIGSDNPPEQYSQVVRVKIFRYNPTTGSLALDSEVEGIAFNKTDFWDSGDHWGIANIGSYINQSGQFILAGINGVDLGSIKQRAVWFTSFGVFTVTPPSQTAYALWDDDLI